MKETVLKTIMDAFDYDYKIYNNGTVVIDDGLSTEIPSTLEKVGKNYCGHLEYKSIDEALINWLTELKNGKDAQKVFEKETKFIETMVMKM